MVVFSPHTVVVPWFEMIPLFCSSRQIHLTRKDACISEKRQEIYAIGYLSVEPSMTTLSLNSALMGQLNQITLESNHPLRALHSRIDDFFFLHFISTYATIICLCKR